MVYVGMYVSLSTKNMYAKMCERKYVAQTRATQSLFWELKWTCDTRIIHFYYMLEQL